MDVASALAGVNAIKCAFLVLTGLALTTYKWPVHKDVEDNSSYDYIIVGAGTAGSIVANRLSEESHVTVLVIEAGGDPPLEAEIPSLFAYLPKSYMDWNYTSEDDGYTAQYRTKKYLDLQSGKVLGGSSTLHHFYHVRGDTSDYDAWVDATGDDSWSWKNLLPYFMKNERLEDEYIINSENLKYHGTDGNIGITRENRDLPTKYLQAFSEMGHKILENVNGEDVLGFTRPMYYISKGVHQSTAESFLSPIKRRPNLHVMKNALVTKILFDENKQATGVQCTTSNGNVITVNAQKEVIVSAGTFNTPKLLMLSGVGPKDHLDSLGIDVVSDVPVGENLQDHLAVILLHLLETTNETPSAAYPGLFPIPSFIGYGAVNKTQSNPDYITLNLISRNNPAALMQLCSSVFSLHDDICNKLSTAGDGREVLFTVFNLGRPVSRGKLQLRSTDPEDPPYIYTGFLSDDADLEKNAECIEDFISVTESNYFRSVEGETMYFDFPNCTNVSTARKYWKCYILHMMDTTFHYSSTCSMGTVLDSNLLVKGVTRLRVVDASAMPNITSGKINAAVLVIAEKAADLIKQNSCSYTFNNFLIIYNSLAMIMVTLCFIKINFSLNKLL